MKTLASSLAATLVAAAMLAFPQQLSAQNEQNETITGCLTHGDRSGYFSLREEGTGFTITVTGSADLQPYSANHRVRLTGRMVREAGRDVFRVTNVEQLAATCEPSYPMQLSKEGVRDVVGRATVGVRGGIGFDPELIYIGAHAQLGPIVNNLWFRPSYEFGFGEVTKINSLNLDFAYYLPLVARGAGTGRREVWSIYVGAGPAFHLSHRNFEEEDINIDFGDWDYDTGLNFIMGVSQRGGLFAELRGGAYGGTPSIKLLVGFNF
jgi:hypothetical protein